ncbi:MAG: hypothetical protein ACK8QZ_06830, partial [Anaerolineales bacterium]
MSFHSLPSRRVLVFSVLLFLLIFGASWLLYDLPSIAGLSSSESLRPSVRILDRNGVLLYDVLAGGERYLPLAPHEI